VLRPRFFTRQALEVGALLELEAEPSRHIARALRLRPGNVVCLFGGNGLEAAAEIIRIDRRAVHVSITACTAIDRESPHAITLGVGVSRGDRMDTIVQKATELGVAALWLFYSERTEVRYDAARVEKKLSHWRGVIISACEQCGRNRLPAISEPASLDAVLRRASELPQDARRLFLHPTGDPGQLEGGAGGMILLAGPEGGFSNAEAQRARDAGFDTLRLGPRILRAETAPIAALAIAQARCGDLAC